MGPRVRALGMMSIAVGLIEGVTAWFMFDRLNGFSLGADFVFLPSDFLIFWLAFVVLMSIPFLVVGIALMRLERWARTVATVVLTCGIVCFPFGTALGLYALLLLTSPEVDEVFSPRFRTATRRH